jgi:hypothetical protein
MVSKFLIVGGTADHVHIPLSLPAAIPLAKAVRLVKRYSFPLDARRNFAAGGLWRVHARRFSEVRTIH